MRGQKRDIAKSNSKLAGMVLMYIFTTQLMQDRFLDTTENGVLKLNCGLKSQPEDITADIVRGRAIVK